MKSIVVTLLIAVPLGAQGTPQAPLPASASVSFAALADSVAGHGSTFAKTRRLVHWINDSFTWSYTDYVQRTPQQIVAQQKGNCAELASVLYALLSADSIRSRWIREINVQPGQTPDRQKRAAELVVQKGKQYSAFGLQHNDHVWLEVWDDSTQKWFPADAAYGVVGIGEWLPARLAMEHRPLPRVAAVVPIAADMVVPFVVEASEKRGGPYDTDRTHFYLIDGFRQLYGDRITGLPAWPKWVTQVEALSPHAHATFAGAENLHDHTADIAAIKQTYDEMTRQTLERGWSFLRE